MKNFFARAKNFLHKLNNHTHVKVPAQFFRGFLLLFLAVVFILFISSQMADEAVAETQVLETRLTTVTKQRDFSTTAYEELLQLKNDQENNIIELEVQIAQLQAENYALTHPQKSYNYTSEELEWLAKLIWLEAGSEDCTDEHQQLVAAVVLCRVNSDKWANTIKNVISQGNGAQYGSYGGYHWYNDVVPQRCYDNALKVLNGEVDYPDNLTYQSSFRQRGFGAKEYQVYKTFYTESTGVTTYFCLGE